MNDDQLLRYSRHILLPEIDVDGQAALLAARVLIIGAGGLGSPAAMYLASAGVGEIVLCDGDTVDLTNLQRQILHSEHSVGQPKVESGRTTLARLNHETRVDAVHRRLEGGELAAQVARASVVLDCSDNFATRHEVNRACVEHRIPLVSGAAIQFSGQVSVFDLRQADKPCYHCLFPQGEDVEEMRCAVMGVLAPLTGLVGSIQAIEAIKLIAGCGQALIGRLLIIDALGMEMRTMRYGRDPACPVCSGRAG
jgi:molybdopterin-synthase adenylyltransferase